MEYGEEYDEYDAYGYHGGHDMEMIGDMDYERQVAETYKIPEVVRNFLLYLAKAISEGNVYELQSMYETSYVKLTERFYKSTPWPLAKDVAAIVGDDEKFDILYKELYYRHLYARVSGGPSIAERFESYYNYCCLFNLILSASEPVQLELPNQWLWEIIDEFIYQFQNFSHYQSMLNKRSTDEIEQLRQHPKVWNVHSVLNVLHSLVDKSNINRQLEVYTNGGDPDSVAGEFGRHPLYKMLGYFSLVGLLRLHSLLGDYYQAIKVLENIELNKKSFGFPPGFPACQITTYYYVGFSYLMMRRYSGHSPPFPKHFSLIKRPQKIFFQQKTYQADQMNKQTERMYTLLTICLVLHPQRIDESVLSTIKEKIPGEKILKKRVGKNFNISRDLSEFEACFSFACPKFLSPVPPSYDIQNMDANSHREPFVAQLKVFMDEVRQQIMLPTIRSYLKLYTTMPIAKLAKFLEMKEELVVNYLLCFKHKMKNMVWTKGTSGLEGEFQSGSEVDFFIDKDMIHIADTKVAIRYGDFFIRQIHKFDEMHRMISAAVMGKLHNFTDIEKGMILLFRACSNSNSETTAFMKCSQSSVYNNWKNQEGVQSIHANCGAQQAIHDDCASLGLQ
ncbi:Eukaryotic translation initiation factor 3 like protein [Argiope bruennichi]|uniref:Eukaryotic translation initiation factor 3 subunit L n=1 Tax=Argiope bruennichi TaxID=94029 RepID=A0A8T0FN23_ARGBR|nr:Eukaryotic translation initiation factor 3 like protein [Argiope bruennichi]